MVGGLDWWFGHLNPWFSRGNGRPLPNHQPPFLTVPSHPLRFLGLSWFRVGLVVGFPFDPQSYTLLARADQQ